MVSGMASWSLCVRVLAWDVGGEIEEDMERVPSKLCSMFVRAAT
jgi:hypothetical protein